MFGVPADHTIMKYISRSCVGKPWAVSGKTADGKGGGIIAWCWDEEDAKGVFLEIQKSGLFTDLSYGPA